MENEKTNKMSLNDEQCEQFSKITDIGDYIKMNREAKGYTQHEVCDGICSEATLSRVELGEKTVDFRIIESILDRMKLERSEYEFLLDAEDYFAGKERENIDALVEKRDYKKAEIELMEYEKKQEKEREKENKVKEDEKKNKKDIETRKEKNKENIKEDNVGKLHEQFLYFWKGILEREKEQPDWEKIKDLFINALILTAPDYKEKFERKEILSNLEIRCITEIINCNRDSFEKEKRFEDLYTYFLWNRKREGFFPPPYRIAMQYYAECLYENEKFDSCIHICSEVIMEFYGSSKLGNRVEVFHLRAKAREKKGFKTKEDWELCLKDLLVAYYGFSFYGGEKEAETLKKYIEETYGWQFI